MLFHRLKKGLSKLALAQRAGLDQRTITFIETGVQYTEVWRLYF
ncbi:MAG: helix-turn-helix transcriptional regulator [Akkermansiaceae bacterium]|nr:helix-turn-helix transcriptional regulator [Akkermansiaceae bacterium]